MSSSRPSNASMNALAIKIRAYPRQKFHRPFIDVHIGMDATPLFHQQSALDARVEDIEGAGFFCEKTIGVIVGTAQRLAFDKTHQLPW